MRLFIAEKPDLARAIVAGLGGNFAQKNGYYENTQTGDIVTYCYGHMLSLKDPKDIDPEKYKFWSMQTLPIPAIEERKIPSDKAKQVAIIRDLVKQADTIVNAGDPDDEGQLLIDELLRYFKNKKPVLRVLINDNTPAVVQKSLANLKPNADYEHLGWIAESRMRADQSFGYNLTIAYSLVEEAKTGVRNTIHIGRVQTPILGLVVRRDREHKAHQKSFYYTIVGEFAFNGILFNAKYQPKDTDPIDDNKRLSDKVFAQNLANLLSNQTAKILLANTQSKKEPAPLPYNLLKLQQDASRLFGLSADETLSITQNLREKHHLITYNRSDCQYLSDEQFSDVSGVLTAISQTLPNAEKVCFNANPNLKGRVFDTSKVTAHHAIIPTMTAVDWSKLNTNEQNIYRIIARSYIAQFYPAYEYDETKLIIDVIVDDKTYQFYVTSRIDTALGWKHLYKNDGENEETQIDEDTILCDLRALQANTQGKSNQVTSIEQETKPKPLYTESTLLGDLTRVAKYVKDPKLAQILRDKDKDKKGEHGGIGTPATRSNIIKLLFERGYLQRKGKNVISTSKGQELYDKLDDLIRYPDMTALWHEQQKNIKNHFDVVQFIEQMSSSTIIPIIERLKAGYVAPAPKAKADLSDNPRCPRCNRPMALRDGKHGIFWGCTGWNAKDNPCNHSMDDVDGKPVEKQQKKPKQLSQFDCKACGSKLIHQMGIYKAGKNKGQKYSFFGCSNYPKCTQNYPEVNGEPKYE